MEKRRLKFSRTRKFALIAGLLLLMLFILLLRHAGTYLVKQSDILPKSDAAVILMGSIADRVLEAADVYKSGLTDQIVFVNNIQYGSEYLANYDVTIPNFATLSVDALQQLGVPDTSIFHLPGRCTSTRDEADSIASWLLSNPDIQKIAIISSSAHTRRAGMIFNDCFRDHHIEVEIATIPSKYSEFNAEQWWKDRESTKQVFMEWVKIVSFVLVEKWK